MDDAPPLAPACLACDAHVYCPRCPAWSSLETGTLTEPVPYLCEIARTRRNGIKNMYNIPITIADILIEMTSPLDAAELGIEARLGPFSGAAGETACAHGAAWEESQVAPSPHGELIYDPGSIWRMSARGRISTLRSRITTAAERRKRRSILAPNAAWDNLKLTEQRTGTKWQSLLNIGVGELLLRTKIIFTGGVVFHSSFVDDNGHGILFVGHSGEGKSTQADLWGQVPGVIVINHDRNAVRPNANDAVCYGTPWGGTANIAHHAAPSIALILLEQRRRTKSNRSLRLPPRRCCSRTRFLPYWDQSLMQRALANLRRTPGAQCRSIASAAARSRRSSPSYDRCYDRPQPGTHACHSRRAGARSAGTPDCHRKQYGAFHSRRRCGGA